MDPFWRNVGLVIISFVMFIGTIYIYFRLKSRSFLRIRQLLEERVEVKSRQLSEINIELETLSMVASRTGNSVLIADANGQIEWANEAFFRKTGNPNTINGKALWDINIYKDIQAEFNQAIDAKQSRVFESKLEFPGSVDNWISTTLTPIFDEANQLKKIVVIDTDISGSKIMQQQIEESLKEKEVLLKEIHHRVKNNLQIIISLLNLQSGYIKDEYTLKAVKDGQNRVRSMALVHEKFYQSDELSEINFNEYLEKLCQFLYQSYGDKTERIEVLITGDHVGLDMDTAMPCGLLINEIVSNAYKYAFPKNQPGMISIHLKKTEDSLAITVFDNGIGLPEGFEFEGADSLGMQLIQALTSQLDGELKVSRENGTTFRIQFPYPKTFNTK